MDPYYDENMSGLCSLTGVLAIAHRGGSKLRPENTVVAFDHAVSLGVDGCECDVHLSADGEPVVIHDPTLDRTTDATGPVSSLTAVALSRVDAGHRFGADRGFPFRGRSGGVPRLADLLVRHSNLPWIVEIKGDRPEVAERVVGVIRACGATDRVIVGGFSQAVLDAVRRLGPELVTSASRDEARAAVERAEAGLAPVVSGYRLFQMPFRLDGRQTLHRPFVTVVRRAGVPVQAWIVDDAAEMRELIDWGVTGIISDRPDVAIEVVRSVDA
jgi:glycerophosphoryl diester phosphodiesterase